MPERIQRKRTRGWRMPEGAVYVGRPTVFGNPFHPPYDDRTRQRPSDRHRRVEAYRDWLTGSKRSPWFGSEAATTRERLLAALPSLRERDLVCWCPLDQPCHADVLLEMANRETEADRRLAAAQAAFQKADDEYMRRLNDPDGYLPTHSGPGRLQWLQVVARMERAADNLRAAKNR